VNGRAVSVHTKDGETVRTRLASAGWLDISKKPKAIGSRLLFPVMPHTPDLIELDVHYEWVITDLETRQSRPATLREAPGLPPGLAGEVTRSMDVVGDIAIIRLKDELVHHAEQIGQALLWVQPRLRAVAVDGGVKGELRLRDIRLIAGKGPLTSVHREYGLELEVDLEKAYFSPRLATEHNRVAKMVEKGEILLDMFTGIGPFAIMAARMGNTREVHAIDLNEEAIRLAEKNAGRNRVGHLVQFHVGDAREVVPTLGTFNRIVMNHPHGARDFLEMAMRAARKNATIHLHLIGRHEEADEAGEEAFEMASRTGHGGARLATTHVVRTYAPGIAHYCLDIVLVK
jgi:tRNA (guanine37-N1)-methyltransferase